MTPAASRIVEVVTAAGVNGASVLEIGGGIGEIQLELLKRGAANTTNLELSGAYESEAKRLITESGFEGQVQRKQGIDLAVTPEALDPFDVVVLHRVVCCYPDFDQLLSAAATHARRTLVFSHPPDNWFTRLGLWTVNAWSSLLGSQYRGFSHDPDAMVAVLERHGFKPIYRGTQRMWRIVGASRLTP